MGIFSLDRTTLGRTLNLLHDVVFYHERLLRELDDKKARANIIFQQVRVVKQFLQSLSQSNALRENTSSCLDILEYMVLLDRKNSQELFHIDKSKVKEDPFLYPYQHLKTFSRVMEDLFFSYDDLHDVYSDNIHREHDKKIADHLQQLAGFFRELSKFSNQRNSFIEFSRLFDFQPIIHGGYMYNSPFSFRQGFSPRKAKRFLSRHDPENESLSDVLDQLVACMNTRVAGYDIIDLLGQGAFKKVYLARSKIDTDKHVALAVFDPEDMSNMGRLILSRTGIDVEDVDPEVLEKELIREFRPSLTDKIPLRYQQNVVRILHVGRTRDGNLYMTYDPYEINVKDYIENVRGNMSLEEFARMNPFQRHRLSAHEIIRIMHSMASGLYGCHEAGIIHRDFHAGNIGLFLSGDEVIQLVLTDFGQISEFSYTQEKDHSPMSPLQTRPPEQFLTREEFQEYKNAHCNDFPEEKDIDFALQKRANIFNFGCVAYQIITGQVPFRPRNPEGTFATDPFKLDSEDFQGRYEFEQRTRTLLETKHDEKGSYKSFLRASSFLSMPYNISAVITKCLMYHPKDRYSSFQEVLSHLPHSH